MKTKKEMMSQQDSEKAPVSFHDVAACFSEEEWKLLHDWQKDIYKNVMKEIHQALISLGPVIAASVFSLGAKAKQHLWPADHQESERGHSNNHSPSATSSNIDVLRISREQKQCLKNAQDTDGRESNDHLSTGIEQEVEAGVMYDHASKEGASTNGPISGDTTDNPDLLFGMKEYENQDTDKRESNDRLTTEHEAIIPNISFGINKEGETYTMAHQGSERRGHISSPTGFPSLSTEPAMSFMDHTGAEGGECSTSRSSGQEVIPPVISFSIKEEGEAYFMGYTDSKRKASTSMCTGFNTSINSPEQQQASGWEITYMSRECDEYSNRKLDVINNHRIKPGETFNTEAECDRSLNQGPSPVKHKGTHTEHRPSTSTVYVKGFNETPTLSSHQKIHAGLKLYICSQCGNCFNQSENETAHHQINKEEQKNVCSECEKSVCQPTNLNKDLGKHIGERPFTCSECGKSFRKSQTLMTHQRLHTGEKPYKCNQCGKDFRQLAHLVKHQRLHTGEKPYMCYLCERRFITSSNLKRHQQMHTRELEIVNRTTEG